ncbi:MAG: ABC transporter substrate-binding protein [Nocardioidaceae bacterium]
MLLKKPIIAVSTVGLLALAACGGSNSGAPSGAPSAGNTSGNSNGGAGAGQDPTLQPPAAPIPGAKTGGTVYVDRYGGTETFDPTESYYVDTASILENLVTRSLTQYIYKNGDMVLVPDLATNLGTHNKDFTSWTFTIRKGVKFEDGTLVTPADIKYGIERSFDRVTFPTGANYSNQYFLDGDKYNGPYKSGTNYNGVVIKGQNLTIKMAKPFPDMPYWGSFPAMGPIPPGKASDPATYKLHPLASGPYMFKPGSYTPAKALTLVKNPYWSAKTDPGRHQYVNQWVFNFNQDSSKTDAIILKSQGAGATTVSYDNVLSSDYLNFQNQAPNQLTLGTSPCTYMWYPDYRKITNITVRRAIGWAYPYKSAWNSGGSIEGVTRIPASNIMPPGIPKRSAYNPLPGHTPASTDAAKAKALLKSVNALGYKIIFPYEKDVSTSVAVKDQIVTALTAAGFTVVPYATTSANYYTVLSDPKAPINVRSVGWCSDWPTGGSWFPPVFQTVDIAKQGSLGSNYAAFSEPSVDKQISKIQSMPLAQQSAAWNALDKYIQTKYYPVVVTGYGGDAMPHGSMIHGMNNDATLAMPTWRDMWVG